MESLFKWFTLTSETITPVRISWFVKTFSVQDFEGVEKLFMAFLLYCRDLGIVVKRKYLESYLRTEGRKDIKKYNVRLDTMESLNYNEPAAFEEAYKIIVSTMLAQYDAYLAVDISDSEFKVDVRSFMEVRKRELSQKTLAEAFPKFTQGFDVDEIIVSIQEKMGHITETYNVDTLVDLDFMSGERRVHKDKEIMRFLFKTGIPCIDGDVGGLYSKQVWSLTGQPGAGKTRLALAHFVYQAAVVWKLDTLVDELEMSAIELENILIAYHIINLYRGQVKIPDKLITGNELSDEQMRYVEAARMDLFESNGKYGKITIRDKGLVAETFEREMYDYLRNNRNTQFWLVDYAGLTKSVPQTQYDKPLIEYECIQHLYKGAKELAKKADIGVLILNQFNEEGIKAAYTGKRIMPGHVQGGQIVQRHADYDIAMCMTEQQEIAGLRTLTNVKRRSATGFHNVPFSTDLSVSIFNQIKQSSTN